MARVKSLANRPIEQYNSPNGGGAMSDHRGIVLHIAQGTYRGTIGWQMNPNQRYAHGTRVTTSSTWVVGKQPGEWAQMVDSDLVAWTQRDGSRTWLSIELAGFAPDKPTAWQVEACAQLLVWAHRRYRFPLQVADHPGERGLGHHSFDREWLGENFGHDECPGSGVIGAKLTIVRRAIQIVEGDDDDMPYKDWPKADRDALAADVAAVSAAKTLAAVVGHRFPRVDGNGNAGFEKSVEYARHHAGGAKTEVRALRKLVEAALAANQGADTQAILARIDQRAAEDAARDTALLALLEQHADGSLDAEAVVRRLGELLTAGDES